MLYQTKMFLIIASLMIISKNLSAETITGKVLIPQRIESLPTQQTSFVSGRIGLAQAEVRVIDVITEKEIEAFGRVQTDSQGQYTIKIPANLPQKTLKSLAIIASKEDNGQQIHVEVYIPNLNPKIKNKIDLNPETTAASQLLTYTMDSQNDDALEGHDRLSIKSKARLRKQLDKAHKVVISAMSSLSQASIPVYYTLKQSEKDLALEPQIYHVKRQLSEKNGQLIQQVIDSHPEEIKLSTQLKVLKNITKEVTEEILGETMDLNFTNNTHGKYTDEQIYIGIIGRNFITDSDGERPFAYINKDGDVINMKPLDNDLPDNKLSKNGQNYSNYFFTLKEAKHISIPKFDSSRIYIGLGSPVYIQVNTDINGRIGYAGPNIANPSDPNTDIYFDWFEFAYNDLGFFGNTTQVDQFGFPMTYRLQAKKYDKTLGILEKRSVIFDNFLKSIPSSSQQDYKVLVQKPYRIVAPGKSPKFNSTYMDKYINEVWKNYSNGKTLTFKDTESRTFIGTINAKDEFVFSVWKEGIQQEKDLKIEKPDTMNVLEGSGPLASGNDTEKVIGSFLCAAFNRGVFFNPEDWNNSTSYYLHKSSNFYSQYWHQVGIDQKAYGFAYDDIYDHSTLVQAPEPKALTINIGWD